MLVEVWGANDGRSIKERVNRDGSTTGGALYIDDGEWHRIPFKQ